MTYRWDEYWRLWRYRRGFHVWRLDFDEDRKLVTVVFIYDPARTDDSLEDLIRDRALDERGWPDTR